MANETPWEADTVVSAPTAEQTVKDAPWLADQPTDPTFGEKAGAFGRTMAGSAVETGSVLGGAIMGGQLGALGGPAAPVTVPLGIAVGGAAGYFFGDKVRDLMKEIGISDEPENLPPALRPYGYAGEVAGGAAPFTAAPMVAAQVGARVPVRQIGTGLRRYLDYPIAKTESFINRVIDWAQKAPLAYLGAETAATAGSAAVSGVSEAVAPGDTGLRLAGEVAGGFFNLPRIMSGLGRMGIDKTRQVVATWLPGSAGEAARQTQAGRILQEIVEAGGDDPAVVAQLLRASGLPGVGGTTAQKSGLPSLIALENHLTEQSAKFGSDASKTAKDSLETIEGLVTALRGTGDPAALAAAADLRAQHFRALVAARVQSAERDAVEAARGIAKDSPKARADLSVKAHELVEGALKDVRAAERELWDKVPGDIPADTANLQAQLATIRQSLLPEEKLPQVVEDFFARMKDQNGVTTSGELKLLRSRALEWAREADAGNRFGEARIFGRIAEGALDDLDQTFDKSFYSGFVDPGAYESARTFSRELHDTFTRTFAGAALRSAATGADRIPPELLLRRALAAGEETGDLRLRQLVDATEFLETKGLGTPEALQNVGVMLDAQERMIRLAAAEAVDPNTGRASATRLAKWMSDNEAILDRFPNIRRDIEKTLASENRAKDIARLATDANRALETRTAFAKIAKLENPVDAVKKALAGPTPVQDIDAFAKLARRGGPEAVEGLRASIWDHAVTGATSGEKLSLAKLRTNLFKAIKPGQPSIAEIMQREKLMSADELGRLQTLFDEAAKIERALGKGDPAALDAMAQNMPMLFDATIRSLGSTAAKAFGGNTLIAQSAGSKVAQNVMNKIPTGRIQNVLIEAAGNPDFAAALLTKPISQAHAITMARQIHGYALQAGLTGIEEAAETGNAP